MTQKHASAPSLSTRRIKPIDAHTCSTAAAAVEAKNPLPAGIRVYLPAAMKKAVWARGAGQCEIIAHGRRCHSRTRLEIDHIKPLALGGPNILNNLRLACWHHNQEQARSVLGNSAHLNVRHP